MNCVFAFISKPILFCQLDFTFQNTSFLFFVIVLIVKQLHVSQVHQYKRDVSLIVCSASVRRERKLLSKIQMYFS